MANYIYSELLQKKIDSIKSKIPTRKIGSVTFNSPLVLAPLAGITSAPFRLLMEDLGAGGTVSELISCHGINFKNDRTLEMMYIDPREKITGIQLFGEEAEPLREAAKIAQEKGAKFLDLNMGCPVRKVVSKGGGAALMQKCVALPHLFKTLKNSVSIPFSIKIRLGWDASNLNAHEVIKIAEGEGVEWVAIHGRTRAQGYTGLANWHSIDEIAKESKLPIIGNGDLFYEKIIKHRLVTSSCTGFMLGRGPLRNPFLFLESFAENIFFSPRDYLEVALAYHHYLNEIVPRERTRLVELRKEVVWMATGYPHSAAFRGEVFKLQTEKEVLDLTKHYFGEVLFPDTKKMINHDDGFMSSGHG